MRLGTISSAREPTQNPPNTRDKEREMLRWHSFPSCYWQPSQRKEKAWWKLLPAFLWIHVVSGLKRSESFFRLIAEVCSRFHHQAMKSAGADRAQYTHTLWFITNVREGPNSLGHLR